MLVIKRIDLSKNLSYIFFILLSFFSFTSVGQTTTLIIFDNASNWIAGSGALNSYQTDHTYNEGIFSVTTSNAVLRQSIGTIDLQPTTSSGAYAWRMQDAGTGDWIANIATGGVYSIVATDANGCSNTVTSNVVVNALPTVLITPSYDSICAGDNTTLTASGATNYAWSNMANTASITESPASTITYSVIGTDGNGCMNTSAAVVTVTPIPAMPTATTVDPICAIGLGKIDVTSPLVGPYAYSIDGTNYQSSPNFTPMSGTYNVTVRDTSNTACVSSPLTVTLNGTMVVCDPNIAVGASALPVAIPEGDSANVEYYISNVGNYPTNDTILILISKPINGTLDVTIPAGWNTLLNNPSVMVLEAPSVVILPGLLNRVTIPANYIHNGLNEDALRIINIIAQPASGGETLFNNNEGQTYIQIN